jgi:hypothetical protein
MNTTQLKRLFLYRAILKKQFENYSEVETNVIIAIYLMNKQFKRCTGNTLLDYLSAIHRTPYKQRLLGTLRRLKMDAMIRVVGKGAKSKIVLTLEGDLYLIRLEESLRKIRFYNVELYA